MKIKKDLILQVMTKMK